MTINAINRSRRYKVLTDGSRVDVVGGANDWQLASGHFVPAKMSPQIIYPRPDAETASYARHRNLYPSLAYRIPVVVQGGAWPFKYELTGNTTLPSASIGGTLTVSGDVQIVGSDYGMIYGTAPASGGPYTVEVKVTDQDGAQVTRSWSVTIGTSAFVFYDSTDTGSLNTGTIDEPFNDMASLAGTSYSTTVNGQKIVYMRAGTHALGGFSDSTSGGAARANTYYVQTNARKPVAFLAYPGEAVTLSFASNSFEVNGSDDWFFGGIEFDGNPDRSAEPHFSHQVQAYGTADRIAFFECAFTNYSLYGLPSNTSSNPSHLYFSGGSTRYLSIVRCTWDGTITNGVTAYECLDSVIEHCELMGTATINGVSQNNHGFWYLKDGGTGAPGLTSNWTVRANNTPATISGVVAAVGVNDQGGMQYVEVCWNRLGKGSSVSFKSPTDGAGSLNRVWVYRNGMEGGQTGVTSSGLTNLIAEYNAQNSGSWSAGYSSSNNQIAAGNLDSSLNLTGAARTNYLGTHGAEVA